MIAVPMRSLRWFLLVVVLLAVLAFMGRSYVRAAAVVIESAGIQGWPERAAAWTSDRFEKVDTQIVARGGPLRARIYKPDGGSRRTLVLVPGVHADGIDEQRLVGFAGHLAAHGT